MRRTPFAARPLASDRGIALITVLLLLMLVTAVLAGFSSMLMSEQRLQQIEQHRSEAFYASHGALEKLTADLGSLFATTYAPRATQVTALSNNPPTFEGITFPTTTEGPGYAVTFPTDANGNPAAEVRSITSGTFQGFTGLVTPYTLATTARTVGGGEVRLTRQIQTIGIPLFQFGQFSETDLGFHSGGDFDFGGRVHTNRHLFLAAGTSLVLSEKVTVVGEVVRTHLMNGSTISGNYPGNVRIIRSPGLFRNLATTEGSLVNTIGSAANEPTWSNLSQNTYASNITNWRTGAKRLDLPLVADGYTPIELIRRPPSSESTTNSVFQQRYYALASLRIMLSDTAGDITSLPTVSSGAPIELNNEPAGYAVSGAHPPFAKSHPTSQTVYAGNPSVLYADYKVPLNSTVLGGFLKIEMQTAPNTWEDVTLEILDLGIAGHNLNAATCPDPDRNAVIRIQRLGDHMPGCAAGGSTTRWDYWPMVLYDTREALRRETESTTNYSVYLGGVIHYIELDVTNLSRWFSGQIGASGTRALADTGYTVYFSDRRGNRNAAGQETGNYGFEDFVNPLSSTGTPNNTLDQGEDTNGNGVLETYGAVPGGLTTTAPLDSTARPWTQVARAVAQVNPPKFFRRALKLTNGRQGSIISPGLTVASENPVYIQGDYNANGAFGNPHVSCSVAADAVTLLSNNWNDRQSFLYPHAAASRQATSTWYRVAVLAGKGVPYPKPTSGSPPINFGTDGGVHNFLRLLESWANDALYYRGSMASLYYSRQGLGVFKDGSNTYDFPNDRDFRFDTDFLSMNLLPPRTPMFRDINVLGFAQTVTAPR